MTHATTRRAGLANRLLLGAAGVLLLALLGFIVTCLVTHPFDSPFHHQYGQTLHAIVWSAKSGRIVGEEWDTYTGVVRLWDDRGMVTYRMAYRDGKRHGVWIDYHKDGSITRVHEYRDGAPWNGVCNCRDGKAFRCEYRQGQLWNGVLPVPRDDGVAQAIDGKPVTEAEFSRHYGLTGADDLIWSGQPTFTQQQLREPVGVVLPGK